MVPDSYGGHSVVLMYQVGRGLDFRVVDTNDTDYLRSLNRGSYFSFNLGVGGQDGPFPHCDLWEASDDLIVHTIVVQVVDLYAVNTENALGGEVTAYEERKLEDVPVAYFDWKDVTG